MVATASGLAPRIDREDRAAVLGHETQYRERYNQRRFGSHRGNLLPLLRRLQLGASRLGSHHRRHRVHQIRRIRASPFAGERPGALCSGLSLGRAGYGRDDRLRRRAALPYQSEMTSRLPHPDRESLHETSRETHVEFLATRRVDSVLLRPQLPARRQSFENNVKCRNVARLAPDRPVHNL